ncbi:hypothetical protein [Kitasatospora aureofaciens]
MLDAIRDFAGDIRRRATPVDSLRAMTAARLSTGCPPRLSGTE